MTFEKMFEQALIDHHDMEKKYYFSIVDPYDRFTFIAGLTAEEVKEAIRDLKAEIRSGAEKQEELAMYHSILKYGESVVVDLSSCR
jgi:hypothetical protein